jgi:type II secretory pathway pseudopilin PulG
MTLLELLLTMVLLGVMLGIGVGVFSSLDFSRRSALALVQNVVRSARNAALARAAPARVRIDVATGTLAATALDVAGTWRFEGEGLEGAFGIDGRNAGAEHADEGYLGRALRLSHGRASYVELDAQDDPGFDLREGFAIDCALFLEGPQSGGVLDVGGAAGLGLGGSGTLRAWLTSEVTATGGTARGGGRILVESQPGALEPGRWQRVRFEYDRRIARLLVDGVEVARTEESAPVWRLEGPLRIGDPRGSIQGLVDDLVVAVVAESEAAVLPPSVRLGPDAPAEVRFDARGHLDREVHAGPLAFQLDFDDGASQMVHIGLYGTVY